MHERPGPYLLIARVFFFPIVGGGGMFLRNERRKKFLEFLVTQWCTMLTKNVHAKIADQEKINFWILPCMTYTIRSYRKLAQYNQQQYLTVHGQGLFGLVCHSPMSPIGDKTQGIYINVTMLYCARVHKGDEKNGEKIRKNLL